MTLPLTRWKSRTCRPTACSGADPAQPDYNEKNARESGAQLSTHVKGDIQVLQIVGGNSAASSAASGAAKAKSPLKSNHGASQGQTRGRNLAPLSNSADKA